MTERCGSCANQRMNGRLMECHKGPPTLWFDQYREPKGIWPPVKPGEWCGKWTRIPVQEEKPAEVPIQQVEAPVMEPGIAMVDEAPMVAPEVQQARTELDRASAEVEPTRERQGYEPQAGSPGGGYGGVAQKPVASMADGEAGLGKDSQVPPDLPGTEAPATDAEREDGDVED